MSPRRKPVCHSCGTTMAGHKRPNGIPVCPQVHYIDPKEDTRFPCQSPPRDSSLETSVSPAPLQREPSIIFPKRWVNPNFVENLPSPTICPARPVDRVGTPNTWVSTEPADDIPVKHEEVVAERFEPVVDDGLLPATSPGPSPQESMGSTSTIRRTFTSILCNSIPVASLFSAPRDEVDNITREARRNGLYTGLIHRPGSSRTIKKEDGHGGLERTSSWWLVLGHSAEAVGHLLDLQDSATMARHGNRNSQDTAGTTETYSVDVRSIRLSYFDILMASMMGGFAVFFLLSIW